MPDGALISRIEQRLVRAGISPPASLPPALATYVELLAKWNSRINLTAYSLDQPSDEALDRLIVEPVSMARFVGPDDRIAIDVGSGGGSPALPFRLAAQPFRQILVESRVRKAAFLREAIRVLRLKDSQVENRRLEDLAGDAAPVKADIVTMRAVRADASLCQALTALLKSQGRFFWLTSERGADSLPGFTVSSTEVIIPGTTSRLLVMKAS